MNTEKWTAELDEITKAFRQKFGNLSNEQLNWKPDAGTWSIAQNIDHLMVINESYYPALSAIQKGSYTVPFTGKFGFLVTMFGKMILKSVKPDRNKKMKTFGMWEPSGGNLESDILDRFEAHQETLKHKIVECRDLMGKGTVISSPANKTIVYTLETAFDIIVTHEQRHFNQACEVLDRI